MKRVAVLSILLLGLATACSTSERKNAMTADTKATAETKKLLSFLSEALDKGIMFGHQDDLSYGRTWKYPDGESDIKRVCSDYPAITGMDLGHIELDHQFNLDSVPFDDMKEMALKVNGYGGMLTFSWHLDNPLTGGSAWDISSDSVVASIIPGGVNHQKYIGWLDKTAAFLGSLVDAEGKPVPVIFRPFHEHTGNWFWWGQNHCTTEEYVALWQFTFDYLVKHKNLHNLLFAYSASGDFVTSKEYLERYPGDDYVDVIGFDYYQFSDAGRESFINKVSSCLDTLTAIAVSRNKIPALTEAGYESVPDSTWWTGVIWPAIKDHKISWFLVWRNAEFRAKHFYAPFPGQLSESDFIRFYELPQTLFREDIREIR